MSSKKITIFKSFSSTETKRFGEKLAKDISKSVSKGARVLALKGNLGAGKTTFTQGFLKALGSGKRAISPTFVIMRRHGLKKGLKNRKFANVFHIDAYRLKAAKNLEVLGFKEIAADSENIIIIEWPEKVKKILPKGALWLEFKYGKKENERKIIITG